MTRLIDADALAEQYTEMVERLLLIRANIVPSHVTTLIINAPTIDAVEVVRCKDCIHYESDGGAMMVCNVTDMVCDNDDFCSYGEKRTKPKTGEWIWKTDIPIGHGRTSAGYICSNCGKDYWHGNVFNYCPSCGADMRGEEE